jgi:hypothetical protein
MPWQLAGRVLLIVAAGAGARGEEPLALLPAEILLHGPEARQTLVLERAEGGAFTGEVREGVTLSSSDPQVVRVEGQTAIPVGNGRAVLTASAGGKSATATVGVAGMDQPHQWSFRNDVEPVLARAGCNTGACHGALAGKRGFKLSLAGYDPEGDYHYITRQARGRRVVLSDPGRSLLLTKPSGALPHKGGLRLAVDSPGYRVLAEWIAAGAPGPAKDDPRLTRLEIVPAAAQLAPGASQQLIVRAQYSDGRWSDVTPWCRFSSSNESAAEVDAGGRVQMVGHGEAAIKAWYQSWNALATMSVAYPHRLPAEQFAQAPRRNFIDELVLAKLQRLNIPPSQPASDGEFLRRAFIDTIGVLPSADETRRFLADAGADKRDRLIEELLRRPEFVDYWSYKWSDLLLVNSEKLRPPAMWAYYHWIRDHVAAGTPWDEFARSVATATGSTLENGAANFYVLHQDPPALAETVSVAFLGMSINCARCHNHPLEKWTNDQYYAMANLFARVRTKDGPGDGQRVVFTASEGELVQPRTGGPQPPQPLDGEALELTDGRDRREHLARWLTAAENPYFARAITNRVWANFFGVGLVEAVDDLRLTNPASNEPLLAAAAEYLVQQRYDLKALMRTILQSHTYARSSRSLPENAGDTRYYSRYFPRRMMAEVLLDAVSQVTGAATSFADYPAGTRALQLPDANVNSYFLRSFGRPARVITCECERNSEPSMVQVLHISNGDTINQKLSAAGNRIDQLLAGQAAPEAILEELYLSALSRWPTAEERAKLLAVLAEGGEEKPRVLWEDVFWGVLSSREFLFQH